MITVAGERLPDFRPTPGTSGAVTRDAGCMFVLAASLGRGASGHHTGLYLAESVVLVLIPLGAAMLRGSRR